MTDSLKKNKPDKPENLNSLHIGVAADHGGFELKEYLVSVLRKQGFDVTDFGNRYLTPGDDFPDYVIPLGIAVGSGKVDRGIAICGSGVGADIIANKISGVRASLISETYSAHQGVEHDNMNLMCLGGRVVGQALATDLVNTFLKAKYSNAEPHRRRVQKITDFESRNMKASDES